MRSDGRARSSSQSSLHAIAASRYSHARWGRLAIDSKLRGCDLVTLRVGDVAPNGYAVDRATVRQRKKGRPVRFELTVVTRQALDDYLRATERSAGECLFQVGVAQIGR